MVRIRSLKDGLLGSLLHYDLVSLPTTNGGVADNQLPGYPKW
jgi:hypothetical protein